MSQPGPEPVALTEDEVRAVVRLLAEALAPNDGRAAKCRRVMDGLCDMAGADGWVWVRSRIDDLRQPINLDFLYGGVVDAMRIGKLAERMLNVLGPGSEFPPLGDRIGLGQQFSATRRQLIDDTAWRDDKTMLAVRASGLDEVMYSWYPMPDSDRGVVWSGAWLYRAIGRPAFDPRACRVAHLVMRECGVLHADGLDLGEENNLKTLTHKQRLVLSQLIDGQSVSQTTENLGLSPHTVNDHIKAIYRHFDVQSRAELMRRFMTVTPDEAGGIT